MRQSLSRAAIDEFRPDVEGLRALAVLAVVLYHARSSAFSGGFVGVDVFFVLSGFLITRLLVRELADTGTISLRAFWARRARRLLPASCLVVVVTVIAGRAMLPPLAVRPLALDAIAAGGLVINFVFAHRLGDYFGAQTGAVSPSPLLHFWSLAVEEQFYLFWPAVLLVATRRPRQYQRLMATIIVVGGVASFVLSSWLTDRRPTWAFYLLPARMGELLVGAILAMAGRAFVTAAPRVRLAAAWLGMAGIGVAVMRYDGSTNFPGTATLLPVLSTALVIIGGGEGSPRFGPGAVLGRQPLQWIGRHSYAIYLWHWPALVLAEARWGPLSVPARLVVIAVAVVLAALSRWLVEDPARHAAWLAARPRRGLVLGASLCTTLALVGLASWASQPSLAGGGAASAPRLVITAPVEGQKPVTSITSTLTTSTLTTLANRVGAAAVIEDSAGATPATNDAAAPAALPTGNLSALVAAEQTVLAAGLAQHDVPSNLRPALDQVAGDRPTVYADGCVAEGPDATLRPCHAGVASSRIKVVLFGDSHAAQWFPALEQIAKDQGFDLVVLAKGGCPTADVSIPTATLARTCPAWRDKAIAYIASIRPALVVMTSSAHYPNSDSEWATGFDATLARIAPSAGTVLVFGDNPGAADDPAPCLSAHLHSTDVCVISRSHATAELRVLAERPVAQKYGAVYVDTTDWFCTADGCPLILGDVLVFRDINHITTVMSEYLQPLVAASVVPILRDGRAPS